MDINNTFHQIVSSSEEDELLRYLDFSESEFHSLTLQEETGNHDLSFVDLDGVAAKKTLNRIVADGSIGNENFGNELINESVINDESLCVNEKKGEQHVAGHGLFGYNQDCITSSGFENAHEIIVNQESTQNVPQIGSGDQRLYQSVVSSVDEILDVAPTASPINLLNCCGCLVLREIVHQNELLTTRVTIHGGIGTFNHAIFKLEYHIEGIHPAVDEFFIDFNGKNEEWIKEFLLQHNLFCADKGFDIQYDSLSGFFDVLCCGMDVNMNMNNVEQGPQEFAAQTPTDSSSIGSSSCAPNHDQPETLETKARRLKNKMSKNKWRTLSEQRERTKKLEIHEIASLYHLPIAQAAEKLELCSTALKHICRRYGVERWPFRKVKSKLKKIRKLQDELKNKSGEDDEKIQKQMQKYQAELESIIREGK